VSRAKPRLVLAGTLLVLVVAAALLRWLYIQQISFFFDEFTTLWAARTVLRRGIPLFESGNFYTHGLLYTYLEAPVLWLFGLEESLLRLPSLFIGVGTVVAVFLIGRRLFASELGSTTATAAGLIAAAAVAGDPEAIAWGGRVRMYALLQLLVLLAVHVFYLGVVEPGQGIRRDNPRGLHTDDRPWLRWLALGLLVAAMFSHAEAALLLPALALAALWARGLRWCLRPSVVGPFLLGLAGFTVVIFGVDLASAFGLDLAEASHLEAIHEVRPYLAFPGSNLLSGLRSFAPAFVDWWRLPFTLVAVAGLVYTLRQRQWHSPLVYLYLVLGVALAELFFLAGPTWQTPRYAFMLLPLLWLVVGAVLAGWLKPRPLWWSAATALALAAFVAIVGYRSAFTQEWGYDKAFRFLQEAWQPGDVVLTTNPPASALYLDQADYYAMQFGNEEYVMPGPDGGMVDRWVAAPVLDSVEQLRQVLATAPRVWLVVDGWRFQSRFESAFIRTVLDQMELAFDERGMVVFLGQGYDKQPEPAVSRPLNVEFGQELALEGYELSTTELQPGEELAVSLLWRALEAPRTTYTVFLHLIGPDGERVAQQDELLLGGYYQPTVWPDGQIVVDRHLLSLPAELAPGRYRLEAGLYSPGDQESILPSADGQDRVVLDHLQTSDLTAVDPETALEADFGGEIRLLGYTLKCSPQASNCSVQLFWRAATDVDVDYTVFVHLVGQEGQFAGQHDGMPEGGWYPTSAWDPGEVIMDEHPFDITGDVPPGDYQLRVGLYRAETGERLAVMDADGQLLGDSLLLTEIPIEADQ
jgi:4-amino-4-deoxy-L-arabinose transferase-like glycosyltransferase